MARLDVQPFLSEGASGVVSVCDSEPLAYVRVFVRVLRPLVVSGTLEKALLEMKLVLGGIGVLLVCHSVEGHRRSRHPIRWRWLPVVVS